jgi:hypothetical protein
MQDFLRWVLSPTGSQVIYNLCLSVAALIGAFAGLKVLSEWLENRKRKRRIKRFSKRYPPSDRNEQGWEIVKNPTGGEIYLLDHKNKTRSWIANIETFWDLGVPPPDYQDVERKTKAFDEYAEADDILTTGRPQR